ncbi:MAG: AbrB/MazE/SpoVT family DNA-binding domain-containing protein [Candidatus Njordarchaeia archaeon]
MKAVVKVRKKGIIILPKRIREQANLSEGDDLLAIVEEGKIILEKLEPLKVKVDPKEIEKILREELVLEDKKIEEILGEG